MSGIAEVLLNLGFKVTGSDIKPSENTDRLISLGAKVAIGHKGENIKGADVVVYSSAIDRDNPELKEAYERHIPVIRRAEMLAELMRMKYGIAVAGTHGKTTTTSMIATLLCQGGLDPTVIIGGRLNSIGSNARIGRGNFLLAEADESDRSFLKLFPTIAVVTNIDPEHMDCYSDMDEVREAYTTFLNNIPFYGLAILNLDHPNIQSLLPSIKRRHITYGKSAQADLLVSDIEKKGRYTTFDVSFQGRGIGRFSLPLPGEHNVYNALAAIAVGIELEMDSSDIKSALGEFSGVQRRFQIKAMIDGIMVVDDYGHHPVEIVSTLRAAKEGWGKRTIVVFQPHRYTRTRDLYKDFLSSFYDADKLIITDIYPAGERPIEGVDAEMLYKGIKEFGHKDVSYIKEWDEIIDSLNKTVSSGDMVIFLGAGDVYQIGDRYIDSLRRERCAGSRGA